MPCKYFSLYFNGNVKIHTVTVSALFHIRIAFGHTKGTGQSVRLGEGLSIDLALLIAPLSQKCKRKAQDFTHPGLDKI
uniref:Uncharacterized protein n=1 Tax=Anguilla anguilla TaxID=7936 RepID=A0A0E9TBZ1_ANGAN